MQNFFKIFVLVLVLTCVPSNLAVKKFMSNKLNLVQVLKDTKNQIFPNQKFAKDIISTVELSIKTGGSAVDQIVALLEEIQSDLVSQQTDLNSAYNQKVAILNQEIEDLQTSIGLLSESITQDNQNVVLWNAEIDQDNTNLANVNAQIAALQQLQQDCINSRAADAAAYTQRTSDQSAVLNAINQIMGALQDALNQKMSGIQITQTQLVEILKKSTKDQVLAKPMQAFVDLSLTFSPDQIQDLMAKLQTIATSFQVSMQADQENEATQVQNFQEQLVKYGNLMAQYQQQVSDLENDLNSLNSQVNDAQARIEANTLSLNSKNQLLDDTNTELDNTNNKYQTDSEQLQSELDTVAQVITIFQASTEIQAYDSS